MFTVIALENKINVIKYEFSIRNESFYEAISDKISRNDAVLNLPFTMDSHLNTILNFMEHLKASTIHHGHVVSGYGARFTDEMNQIGHLDNLYKEGEIDINPLVKWANENEIKFLIVESAEYIKDIRNSKLKLETREKVKMYGISNIEIHSYHSFCVKNYDHKCFTDEKIIHVLENNQPPFNGFDYDIIILDEAQDINPTLYNLICKIYKDNKNNSKLCVLGDKNQSIYDFNFADSRYITFADIIFNFNKLRWSKCTLPFSFRITHEMAEFINNCMMDKPRIYSKKISSRYIIFRKKWEKK